MPAHGMQEVGGSNPPWLHRNSRSEHIYAPYSQRDDPGCCSHRCQPHGPTVTPGTCSATGPEMSKKVRRVRLAGLKIASRQTDPAGECSFTTADLGPNDLRTVTSGDVEATRA